MKKRLFTLTCFLLGLLSFTTQAQIISVTPGTDFNIVAATVIAADSMDIIPSADFTINGSSLIRTATAANAIPFINIARGYQFSSSTNPFSGTVGFNYADNELNSIAENTLSLAIQNGSIWNSYTASVRNGSSNYVQTTSLSNVPLNELTLADVTTWKGSGNGSWNNAANWTDGIPTSSINVLINTPAPLLDVDYSIAVSKSLTLGGTGALTINAANTFAVSGAANFGGKLVTVKSDITGTGSIGKITGTLTGATNVTVERYIPNNGFRSWRLLAAPTKGTQTIRQAWQESAANPNPWDNNLSGYGTQITSTGTEVEAQALGFDDNSLSASMLGYNGTAFVGVPTTNAAIETTKGYFIFVRGDRSVGVSSSISTNSPTTLRTNGTLYQGTQTSATIPANTFGLIGNPYASAIDFLSLTRTGGVGNTFYIWDAKKQTGNSLGLYQTFSSTNSFQCLVPGGSYVLSSTGNTAIQSGQAFFVKATGSTGTVTFNEDSKIASTGNLGYKTTAELVKIDSRLYSVVGATSTMADANVVVFDAAYSNAVDGDDATKFSNGGENLGILRNGQTLVVEGRQPVTASDTIYFRMWNMQAHAYQLEFVPQNLGAQNLVARLEDSYLNTSTTISLLDTTRIGFAVNASAASYASNRFRIVFTPSVVLPVNFISIAASRKTTNVLVSWKVGNELNIHHYEVERSTDGRTYTKAGSAAATGVADYSLLDANAPAITLFYRVKSVGIAGEIKYSAVVKLSAEKTKPGYAVAPNPIVGAEINVQFKNQPAGKYQLKLLNNVGQQIQSNEINHAGGNATQSIQIPAGLARGAYQLEIISADKTSSVETVFINN